MSHRIDSWKLSEIAAAVGGELRSQNPDQPVLGITTDSRSIPPRSLFVALKGERHDAHSFIPAVSGAGARAAIVDHFLPARLDFSLIRVPDTTRALGDLARAYRRKFRSTVAAVTGTSGKTTTKDFLAAICRRRFRTIATTGNLNNHIGVPLSLFQLTSRTEKAVIEMGMSDMGEIARLAEIAEPSIGIITSIGPCHLDRLMNVEGVMNAKAELIEYLNSTNGMVILDADQQHFEILSRRVTCRLISAGEHFAATVPVRDIAARGYEPASFTYRGLRVELRHYGRHAVSNAVLAIAAAETMGVDPLDIVEGIRDAWPASGRANRIACEGVTIIDDAYNANPLSYAAALAALAGSTANRRIVVMADMLELGPDSEKMHAETGALIARSGVDILVHRGAASFHAAKACAGVRTIACSSNEEISSTLDGLLLPGDVVLVKASHSMKLDEVVRTVVESRRNRVNPLARKASGMPDVINLKR
ncbi:MAG: UDP-N-acetylmuramoyl-tripeptide--D-alanyl-D-alanine ligase [Candidatus Hydrogenedentota bacterium]